MNTLEGAVRRAVVQALLDRGAAVVVPGADGVTHDRLTSYDGR